MTNKTPTLAVKNDSITINITQDSVSVAPAYTISISKENHSDKLRSLSLADMNSLLESIQAYITITR